jgi:hypothetical protein
MFRLTRRSLVSDVGAGCDTVLPAVVPCKEPPRCKLTVVLRHSLNSHVRVNDVSEHFVCAVSLRRPDGILECVSAVRKATLLSPSCAHARTSR